MNTQKVIIYTDGGARSNPGPAAIGIVIGAPINKNYGEAIGKTTNNIAEYSAVVFALKKAKSLLGGEKAEKTEIELRSDSELLVKQLNGEYKIKEENLVPLFIQIWNLKQDFKSVEFTHIPREKNKEADKLVNQALDTLI